MSKKSKHKKYQRGNSVFHMTAEEVTLSRMPKYNGYAGGYGVHGDKKYNRNKSKRDFWRNLGD